MCYKIIDLAFITVTVADKDGLLVPRTHNLVKFSIEGPGDIVAVGNGDATSHEPFHNAFNGLCLAIVRTKPGERRPFTVKAQSDNFMGAELKIIGKKRYTA